MGIETISCNCEQLFSSKNKLYKHLKGGCSWKIKAVFKKAYSVTRSATRAAVLAPPRASTSVNAPTMLQDARDAIPIVKSTALKSDFRFGFAFCNWNYAMVLVALKSNFKSHDKNLSKSLSEDQTKTQTPTSSINANWINAQDASSSSRNGCIDIEYGAILIDQDWLKSQLPKAKILKITILLKVKNIETSKYKTDKYVFKAIYFPVISNKGQRLVVYIHREFYLVDNLRVNIFIGNDIIGTKDITIDIANKKAYVSGCKATVPITPRQRGQFVRRALHLTTCIMISLRLQAFVSTNLLSLLSDKDFYFEPMQQPKLLLFAYLISHNTKAY